MKNFERSKFSGNLCAHAEVPLAAIHASKDSDLLVASYISWNIQNSRNGISI